MKNLFLKVFFIIFFSATGLSAAAPWLLSPEAASPTLLDFGAMSCSFQKNTNLSEKEAVLIEHVKKSVVYAWLGISHILESTQRQVDGKSTSRIKHLLSNLCSLPHTRYLEIGLWTGSTFIAALCNNQSTVDYAVGIDNWCEGGKGEFEKNCENLLPKKDYRYNVYSQDCFAANPKKIVTKPINVYFYSGNCSYANQEKAFVHYKEVFDDAFIVVLDNWNQESTRNGAGTAIRKLGYEILFEIDLPAHKKALWWNGLYIAVLRKPS